MPYPPPVPPLDRTNSTPQVDAHPSDHIVISTALTEIINHIAVIESGSRVAGAAARALSTPTVAGSTVLHVAVTPVLDYPTVMSVTGVGWAGSDSSALAFVGYSLNTQVFGTNVQTQPTNSPGANLWAPCPFTHSWVVPAGGSPQFGLSVNWAGGFAGTTYAAADVVWNRYRQ